MRRIGLLLLLLLIELCAAKTDGQCADSNQYCKDWSDNGQCTTNPGYMNFNCQKSCNKCDGQCADSNQYCKDWSDNGECTKNPGYMNFNCQKSCNKCVCDPVTCTYNNQDGRCSRHPLPDTRNVGPQECKDGCECYISFDNNNCENERKCTRPNAESEGYYITGHCRRECHIDEKAWDRCDINPQGSCHCCLKKMGSNTNTCEEDSNSKCGIWQNYGRCSKGIYFWMCKSSCACGIGSNPPCIDTKSQCSQWAAEGRCSEKVVYTQCKSSCACGSNTNTCEEDSNSKCGIWQNSGKCSKGKIFWMCKSSCACGIGSNPPCTDTKSQCSQWAAEGRCSVKGVYTQCKSSCACDCENERKCTRPNAESEGYYTTGHCRRECHIDEKAWDRCDINPQSSCHCCLRKIAMFTGPTNKIWSDSQCPVIESYLKKSFSECTALCVNTDGCTAINFSDSPPGTGQGIDGCVLRGCSEPVPLPDWEYPPYQGYALSSALFTGPTNKIWSDSQCPVIESYLKKSFSECTALCVNTDGCTAINFSDSPPGTGQGIDGCVLRGCSEPVPLPDWEYPPYHGYALSSGSTSCSSRPKIPLPQYPGSKCNRPCKENDARICHFVFNVTEYETMSNECRNCGKNNSKGEYNLSDCDLQDCIPADGFPRPIMVVNLQLPGPAIQVCEHDRLIVTVFNKLTLDLSSETESIHWHGQWQRCQQYWDGVPYVTQCPILAGGFRYDMPNLDTGTYWYHSHSGLHRGDGVFGAMVVRRINDPQAKLYDKDRNILMITDWTHTPMRTMFTEMIQRNGSDSANSILVNGKGRNNNETDPIPFNLETIEVTNGTRYRLRIISGASMTCPIMVSIEEHNFTIIATDGEDINPTTASSFTIYAGERFDIVVHANLGEGNYWIRFDGLLDCTNNNVYEGAILRYHGTADKEDPKPALSPNTTPPPGIHVNPTANFTNPDTLESPNPDYPDYRTVAQLTRPNSKDPSLAKSWTDMHFYLYFEINVLTETLGSFGIPDWRPQINNLSFVFPPSPPLSQPNQTHKFCKYGEKACQGKNSWDCSCTHVLEVPLDNTVEIVLINGGHITGENHPFHLHGYSFYVVAMEQLGDTTTTDFVQNLNDTFKIERNLKNPILKDTVTIPYGSYVIIRFTANNPGWWLMHCHLNFHVNLGMAALLHVGDKGDVPHKPHNFPTCGAFLPDII